MKYAVKFLSFVLALSMLLCLFAACNKNPDDPQGTTEDPATTTGEPSGGDEPQGDLVKIVNQDQFEILIEQLNANPTASKGKTYRLLTDITFVVGWDASPTSAYGKLVAPGEIKAFPGISEFYGVFDGNGYTVSCIYRVDTEEAGGAVGGFIDKLNGGTVKNLTVNSAYVFDNGTAGTSIGGLIGVVNGNGAKLENVTVNANVYAATDGAVVIGGVVGSVAADGFSMTNVTFGGKAGNVAADLSIAAVSTEAILGQMIGDAGGKAVTLTGCAANGALICNEGAAKGNICGANAANVTETNSAVNTPADAGIVEISEYKIYTAQELLSIAAYNSSFEGKTVKLMADIDLNEGWVAGTTAPTNVWTGLSDFKGTFDGNSKILKGIYRKDTDGGDVGFIDKLNGGTVKNLIVMNSIIISDSSAEVNVGFIGNAVGGTVENLSLETSVYASGTGAVNAGGVIGASTGAAALNSIVFKGVISASGKTADLIVASTTDAVLSNILALGSGATLNATGTCVLAEKKPESFLTDNADYSAWGYTTYFTSIVPQTVADMLKVIAPLAPDTSWYDESKTVFELSTAEQLLGLAALAQEGKTFENMTIQLLNSIDLNPGWDATTTVASNNVVTIALPAKNVWTPIPLFKGTIDGKGHAIKGIYSYTEFYAPTSGYVYWGGFITELQGGTIQNLIVENSLAYFTKTLETTKGTANINLGGFIGRVTDSTLKTLYVDMDAWNRFEYHYTMGGMICAVDTNATDDKYVGSIKDIVYAGMTGRICPDGTWNATNNETSNIYCAGMIGQNHNAKTGSYCYVTLENLSFIGIFYRPNGNSGVIGDHILANTGGPGYSNGIAVNNTSCYINEVAAQKAVGSLNKTSSLSGVAIDFKSNGGTATDGDTYTTKNDWATIDIETGAGINKGIILPKTVVDMLNAANNG